MATCEVLDQTPPLKGGGWSGTARFTRSIKGEYIVKRVTTYIPRLLAAPWQMQFGSFFWKMMRAVPDEYLLHFSHYF